MLGKKKSTKKNKSTKSKKNSKQDAKAVLAKMKAKEKSGDCAFC